jgi:hypothetical protein
MIEISVNEDRCKFHPGEVIRGRFRWKITSPAKSVSLRLFWYTQGKGDKDVGIVAAENFNQPLLVDERPFQFEIPAGPYSFSGKLISLVWALEVVITPNNEHQHYLLIVSPSGEEILLDRLPGIIQR